MTEIDIGAWVRQAATDREKTFRAAVHTVLHAIANSPLKSRMIIKGGLLMAVRYQSLRYTIDIDFSTDSKYAASEIKLFEKELETALALAVESLDYGLDCRIQSIKIKPRPKNVTFPTLEASIGYAFKGNFKNHKRLLAGNSLERVKVEYSFNEITRDIEQVHLMNSGEILAYSLNDLIAEKYRAILQQEVRNRVRRQDAYDIFFLLQNHSLERKEDKVQILKSLQEKSASRNLQINRKSLRQQSIKERSLKEYHLLAQELPGSPPDFEEVYACIKNFYESLPWTAFEKDDG